MCRTAVDSGQPFRYWSAGVRVGDHNGRPAIATQDFVHPPPNNVGVIMQPRRGISTPAVLGSSMTSLRQPHAVRLAATLLHAHPACHAPATKTTIGLSSSGGNGSPRTSGRTVVPVGFDNSHDHAVAALPMSISAACHPFVHALTTSSVAGSPIARWFHLMKTTLRWLAVRRSDSNDEYSKQEDTNPRSSAGLVNHFCQTAFGSPRLDELNVIL